MRPAYVRNRELVDKLIGVLSENVQGAAAVEGFARKREKIVKSAVANNAVRDQQNQIFWRLSTFIPTLGFLSQTNLIVLLASGGALVIRGELPLGSGLVVFAGCSSSSPIRCSRFPTSPTACRRVLPAHAGSSRCPTRRWRLPTPPPARSYACRARGEVRFEDVHFDYKEGSHRVLRGMDFRVVPGTCVTILGQTGSGKSALLSLIPRFYNPCRRRVLIDGHDARLLDLDDLRHNIGLVFQESFLFPIRSRPISRSGGQ